MPEFNVNMVRAVKVVFRKKIFEDDFPEKGMTAWLTGIELDDKEDDCWVYKLYFDFADFEEENEKYMREVFYPNIHTKDYPEKELYTAREAGMYSNKYSVYYDEVSGPTADGDLLELREYLIYLGEEPKNRLTNGQNPCTL